MEWTKSLIGYIKSIVFLCLLVLVMPWPVMGVDKTERQALIDRLRQEIKEKGYTFTVGDNPAMEYPLEVLCGLSPTKKNAASNGTLKIEYVPVGTLPAHFDWREQDGVTSIKNQQFCGSCWAFGTVGVLECQVLIHDKVEIDLSEQLLVDCETDVAGCNGGDIGSALNFLNTSGTTMEAWYPYKSIKQPCTANILTKPYLISNYGYVPAVVTQIKQAILDHGPVVCSVAADDAFQAYTGGVYNGSGASKTNHAIILVGWDDNNGNGYWIMKNSWGVGWGENGFMRITWGAAKIGNDCFWVSYGPILQPVLCQTKVEADVTGDGEVEPGETAAVRVTVKNFGADATDVAVTLKATDPLVAVQQATVHYPDLKRGESSVSDVDFLVKIDPAMPKGQLVGFTLQFTAGAAYSATGQFTVRLKKPAVLILDYDNKHDSGPAIQTALNANNIESSLFQSYDPANLSGFQAIFVCLGSGMDMYFLGDGELYYLRRALINGAGLYLEGPLSWSDISSTAILQPWFNVKTEGVGSGDLTRVVGGGGTLWEGLSCAYCGDSAFFYHLSSIGAGQVIFRNDTPSFGCGVSNTEYQYYGRIYPVRCIGVTFKFSGLQDEPAGGTKAAVMDRVLAFFGLKIGDLNCDGHVDGSDTNILFQYLAGNTPLPVRAKPDLDGDGWPTSADLVTLLFMIQ